jgi:hypothetical protein
MRYDESPGSPAAWISEDGRVRIQQEDAIRLKILGKRVDAADIVCCWCCLIHYYSRHLAVQRTPFDHRVCVCVCARARAVCGRNNQG